jgi:hypothetical protein
VSYFRLQQAGKIGPRTVYSLLNSTSRLSQNAGQVILTPYSKQACAWVGEHIPDDAMWFGSSVVIEHRYAAALLAQIERNGLVISHG